MCPKFSQCFQQLNASSEHASSEENPAVLCSRGLLATQLVAQQMFWFQGPSWLGSSFPEQPQTLLTKKESKPRSQNIDSVNFAHIQERSQDDLWPGGNGSRLVCGGQNRSDGTL